MIRFKFCYFMIIFGIASFQSLISMELATEQIEELFCDGEDLTPTLEELKIDKQIGEAIKNMSEISNINDIVGVYVPIKICLNLGYGAREVEAYEPKKTRLLTVAVIGGSLDIVRTLIYMKADVNNIDCPCVLAINRSKLPGQLFRGLAIFRELLKSGAKATYALNYSVGNHYLDIVKILVEEYGEEVSLQIVARAACEQYGKSPDKDMMLYLVSKCHTDISDVFTCFDLDSSPSKAMLELLLLKGADINALDTHGNTFLFHAVSAGNYDLVAWLLDKGAGVNNGNANYSVLNLARDLKKNASDTMGNNKKISENIEKLLKKNSTKSAKNCLLM